MSVKRRPKNSYFDLLTTADCARVLSAYDLGEVVAIESLIVSSDAIVNLLERSETSRKTVVRTTCGSFFLKQIPWYCAQQELVTFSATLANTCSKNGLPVPAVHRTRNGELYTEYDDCLFTVSDLVVGAQYDGTQKLTRSSASVLAQMHNLGRSCNLKVWGPQTSTLEIVEEHIELACRIALEHGQSTKLFDDLRPMTSILKSSFDFNLFPVHGDFIPWNLAYRQDGSVIAVYDFDNAAWDSRLHDVGEAIVAWAALSFSGKHAGLSPRIGCKIDEQLSSQFLDAYEQTAPLEDSERAALPSFILGAWWEALLLGYVKGEIPISEMNKLVKLPSAVEDWTRNVLR